MRSNPGSTERALRQAELAAGAGRVAPTVLHVDDDPNDAELLKAAIQATGAEIILKTVADGDAALDYLKGQGTYSDRSAYSLPSLVLLDLKMPRMTGIEVLNWIRSQPNLGHVRVMILSGSELKDDILNATLNGADGYLVKPLRFESLVNVVRSILGSLHQGAQS